MMAHSRSFARPAKPWSRFGLRLIRSKAAAAPVGRRRPCSQFCSVLYAYADQVGEFGLRQAGALADRAHAGGLDRKAARSVTLATQDGPAFTDASQQILKRRWVSFSKIDDVTSPLICRLPSSFCYSRLPNSPEAARFRVESRTYVNPAASGPAAWKPPD